MEPLETWSYDHRAHVFCRKAFQIIQDHREYPIWPCRNAVMTFLLGEIPILHKDIKPIIAKLVWESRRDRKVWWPDVTDEMFYE
jgi:hypothetical protein